MWPLQNPWYGVYSESIIQKCIYISWYWVHNEAIVQKFLARSRDQNPLSNADRRSSRSEAGQSQPTTFKSFGINRKGSKEDLIDLQEQQVNRLAAQNLPHWILEALESCICLLHVSEYSISFWRGYIHVVVHETWILQFFFSFSHKNIRNGKWRIWLMCLQMLTMAWMI